MSMSNGLEQLDGIQSRHIPTVFEKNIITFPYHYLERIPATPISSRHLSC